MEQSPPNQTKPRDQWNNQSPLAQTKPRDQWNNRLSQSGLGLNALYANALCPRIVRQLHLYTDLLLPSSPFGSQPPSASHIHPSSVSRPAATRYSVRASLRSPSAPRCACADSADDDIYPTPCPH